MRHYLLHVTYIIYFSPLPMKMYTLLLVGLLLMIAIPDIYFYRHLKKKESKPVFFVLHFVPAAFFALLFLYMKFGLESARNFRVVAWVMWLVFSFLLIYIPKIIHILFFLLHIAYQKVFKRESVYFDVLRIITNIIVVVTLLISAFITPRSFDVTHVTVSIPHLPKQFNGYRIVQLSDIHLGSWNHKFDRLKPVITLVNNQHPDIIVFTGDMVNNYAGEAQGWESSFRKMKARDGKYAILGNHDYGDYTNWPTDADKNLNKQQIRNNIRQLGFQLLLNDHTWLHRGKDSLALIGVENWGKSAEYRYSRLEKAIRGLDKQSPKILLSHDPNQWDAEIIGHQDIVLTLSGHTHAAQLGLKIRNLFLSPASIVFKHWAGLYKENNQYLYVNRGIGYIGLPMSVGVRPEITVITLVDK